MALDHGTIDLLHDPARLRSLEDHDVLDTPPEEAFDDIVRLAANGCATPIALVTLVAGDRQWFKARVGFPTCQTELGASVCVHALAKAAVLVIPDLAADPRTADNPLVTGEPRIRFYAGAPLRTAEGHVLGSLCVIDHAPRTGGLAEHQVETLVLLARQVMSQLELRRLLRDREAHLVAQREGADALRRQTRLLRTVTDNVGQAVLQMDRYGAIMFANPSAEAMFGWTAAEMSGRDFHALVHHSHPDGRVFPVEDCPLRQALAEARLHTDEDVVFFRRNGGRVEAKVTTVPFVSGDEVAGAVLTVENLSERKTAERRLVAATRRREALMRLGDDLRGCIDAEAMADLAAAEIGGTLGTDRAAYAAVAGGMIHLERAWSAPGVAAKALGRLAIQELGGFADDLEAGRAVIVADVAGDAGTPRRTIALQASGIAAMIAVPVVEHDRLIAVVLALSAAPRAFEHEEVAFVRAATDRARAAIARKQADESQAVLNGEISHRLKNTLSIVQAIANQTFRASVDRDVVEAFTNRLVALGAGHDVLHRGHWIAADLREVVDGVLETAGVSGRFAVAGPVVRLGPRAALSTSLLLHELATNAGKYGSLTTDEGGVAIAWRLDGEDGAEHLELTWREHGGPPAREPTRQGFGSRLLRMGLVGTGGSSVRFTSDGLSAVFRAPLTQVEQA